MSASPTSALRLTFTYNDGVVQLVSRTPVTMVVPPSDPLVGAQQAQGFWTELQGAAGNLLYRRVMANPIPLDTEVFTGEPNRPIMRVPQASSSGVFTVLVPQLPDAESLVFFSSLHRPAPQLPAARALAAQGAPHAAVQPVDPAARAAAQEIGRFSLR